MENLTIGAVTVKWCGFLFFSLLQKLKTSGPPEQLAGNRSVDDQMRIGSWVWSPQSCLQHAAAARNLFLGLRAVGEGGKAVESG